MKKRILLISNMYPSSEHPTYGTFIQRFEQQMKEEGFIITKSVIQGRGNNFLQKIQKYLSFFWITVKKIRKDDYDLIYVHYIGHSLLPFLFIRKSISKPLVLNAHGSDVRPRSLIGRYIQKIIRPIIKQADLIVVPSYYFKNVVRNLFSVDEKKIFVSPSGGIDTKIFIPSNRQNTLQQNLTIGYVSHINKDKGWHLLIETLKELKKYKKYNFSALIIGDGPDIKELKNCINTYDLNTEVSILGAITHNELPLYYQSMDIFVFPTKGESLGLVGLEALSCGIPVIGSNIPALNEYIKPHHNGYLFQYNSSRDLTSKIVDYLSLSLSQKQLLTSNARQTALKYEAKHVAKNLANILNKLIRKNKNI